MRRSKKVVNKDFAPLLSRQEKAIAKKLSQRERVIFLRSVRMSISVEAYKARFCK